MDDAATPTQRPKDTTLAQPRGAELWAFHAAQEQYVGRNIQLADTKASITMLAASGAIAFLLREVDFRGNLGEGLTSVVAGLDPGAPILWTSILATTIITLLGLAATLSFIVLTPRLTAPKLGAQAKRGSVVYWGDVARFPPPGQPGNYVDVLEAQTVGDISRAQSANLYALSQVCASKMLALRTAMFFGAAGFLSMFIWELLATR